MPGTQPKHTTRQCELPPSRSEYPHLPVVGIWVWVRSTKGPFPAQRAQLFAYATVDFLIGVIPTSLLLATNTPTIPYNCEGRCETELVWYFILRYYGTWREISYDFLLCWCIGQNWPAFSWIRPLTAFQLLGSGAKLVPLYFYFLHSSALDIY
jgi:hypothetical protein